MLYPWQYLKTIAFTYNGPDIHLGRFEFIVKGVTIPFNADEARDVMRDRRFTKDPKPYTKQEFVPSPAPELETTDQQKARLAADCKREAMISNLNRQFEVNEAEKD